MWNCAGWGPMYGMWFMPVFGLLCMLLFAYFISRMFNRNGVCFGPWTLGISPDNQEKNELIDVIRTLRSEVEGLRKKQNEEH